MAQHYTRAADRTRLARDAAQLLLLPDATALTLNPVRAPAKKAAKNQRRTKDVVPRRGLEPPRLAALVPETSASTNSATWALRR